MSWTTPTDTKTTTPPQPLGGGGVRAVRASWVRRSVGVLRRALADARRFLLLALGRRDDREVHLVGALLAVDHDGAARGQRAREDVVGERVLDQVLDGPA